MSTHILYQRYELIIKRLTGQNVTSKSFNIILDRLPAFCDKQKILNLAILIDRLEKPYEKSLREDFIDLVTVHETLFFRDSRCFEVFKTVFEEIYKNKKQKIHIWSAACSTGAEAVSIALSCAETGVAPQSIEILATDISKSCIEQVKLGQYSTFDLTRGMSLENQKKYFTKIEDNKWQVQKKWHSTITPRLLNFFDTSSYPKGFDIIFCRYVLIYFPEDDRLNIIRRLAASLNPGGYLFLGGAEVTCTNDNLDGLKKDSRAPFLFKVS